MPAAIPLVAAAGSVIGGMAAIEAGSMIVGGLMVAGGAMTAVGTLTGDKTLTRLGGLASLAGGIGGLATDAWSAASEVSGMDLAADAAAGSGNSIGTAAQALSGASGAAPGVADAGIQAANQAATSGGGGMLPSATNSGAPTITAPGGGSAITNPLTPAPGDVQASFDFKTPQTAALNAPAPSTIPAASSGGMLQSLSGAVDWAQKNPRLVQAGAGLLSATMGSYAQQEAIKTQLRLEDEARQRQRDRLSQSVVGLKVPTFQRVGG